MKEFMNMMSLIKLLLLKLVTDQYIKGSKLKIIIYVLLISVTANAQSFKEENEPYENAYLNEFIHHSTARTITQTENGNKYIYYCNSIDKNELDEKINSTQLKEINVLQFSPQFKISIGYKEKEVKADKIYLFNDYQRVVQVVDIKMYPKFKFAGNEHFVSAFDLFGNSFLVFDDKGQRICEANNFQDVIGKTEAPLKHVNISNNGEDLILVSDQIYLLSSTNLIPRWKAHSGRYLSVDTHFIDDYLIVCTKSNLENPAWNIDLLDLESGEILDSINNVDRYQFIASEGRLLTFNKGKILKYEIAL